MAEPRDYLDIDYSESGAASTSPDIREVTVSLEKTAIKDANAALKDLESDSDRYATRRPFRRLIKARVIR